MIKTVELVNKWAKFRENHPDGDIEDFCRHYLIGNQKKENPPNFLGGIIPPNSNIVLIKLMGRITRLFMMYAEDSLEGTGIRKFDEFLFLNTISYLKEPKKTEVVYHLITELSTGLNILNFLREEGLTSEFDDTEDKRSKRLRLTPKGKKTLSLCHERVQKVGQLFLEEMTMDDILLCIHLLKNVEGRLSEMHRLHKGKPFEEVYKINKSRKKK